MCCYCLFKAIGLINEYGCGPLCKLGNVIIHYRNLWKKVVLEFEHNEQYWYIKVIMSRYVSTSCFMLNLFCKCLEH